VGSTPTTVTNADLDGDGKNAILDPYGTSTTLLAKGTRYKAVFTGGTEDLAGNALGNAYTWMFTTAS
jgi:hypothetical protein